jgi:ribonucleoside-diphosphate reductase alpha chain
MSYSREEVYEKSLEYFGDELAATVFVDKYALQDSHTGIYYERSPEDMFVRLANEYARIENNYVNPLPKETILELLKDFKYLIPGGSMLFGIGNDFQLTSLSNCFVIHNPEDSYSSIMKTDEEIVQIAKRRGGVGIDISHLRPAGLFVNGGAKSSTGAVSFAERYSHSIREVAQNGRRGALLMSMDIRHPDAHLFRDLKTNTTKCVGANISLKFTDEFLQAVEDDKLFVQRFPIEIDPKEDVEFSIIDAPLNELVITKKGSYRVISAKSFWDKFVHNTHQYAEPGALFWSTIQRESISEQYEGCAVHTTNPCGEITLPPYGACNLMAVNLTSFVENPFSEEAVFDYYMLKNVVSSAQRLVDDAVDLELEAIEKILHSIRKKKACSNTERELWEKVTDRLRGERRTGLGIVGLADALAMLNLVYDSDKAIVIAEKIQREVAMASYEASAVMAGERRPFEKYNENESHSFISRVLTEGEREHGRRNISNLTIAPTGSISLLAGISSGIEPVFELMYRRRKRAQPDEKEDFIDAIGDRWKEYDIVHKGFQQYLEKTTGKRVAEFTKEELQKEIKKSPYRTANEINPIKKVELQSRLQKWVDHSISVTHNLPKTVTEAEVSALYLEAWRKGCKGCTVYRYGSRDGILVRETPKEENAKKRPPKIDCEVHKLSCMKIDWAILVSLLDKKPYEIFAIPRNNLTEEQMETLRHEGRFFIVKKKENQKKVYSLTTNDGMIIPDEVIIPDIVALLSEEGADTKRISLELRHNIPLRYIVSIISKTAENVTSFNKSLIRVLKKYIEKGEVGGNCENCGGKLIFEGNCFICQQCGVSKC